MTGTQLREARRVRGWAQTDLAVKLGESQPYVSLLEAIGGQCRSAWRRESWLSWICLRRTFP